MATFYPVIITAAIFIAVILDNIIQRQSSNIPLNTLQGIISVGLMLLLSFKDMELVSWGLLLLILLVMTLSYFFAKAEDEKNSAAVTSSKTIPPPPKMTCSVIGTGKPSTIGTPTMSAAIASAPYTFTPITSCAKST